MSLDDRIDSFTRAARARADAVAAASDALSALRAAGRDAFLAQGLPARGNESWKYSRLGPLLEDGLLDRPRDGLPAVAGQAFEGLDSATVSIVDGLPQAFPEAPEGVTLTRLRDVAADPSVAERLGTLCAATERPFVALNGALTEDGVFIQVARDARVELPLELVFAQAEDAAPRGAHPRVLLVLEPGARLTLLERQVGARNVFTNSVLEVFVGEGAQLDHLRLALDAGAGRWLTALDVQVDAGARYGLHQALVGAAFRRNEVRVHLAAPGALAEVGGATLTRDRTHLDTQMSLEHAAPHCTSDQRFRAIAGERSRTVLNGRIHIHPHAQKTAAEFNTRNLLLSAEAEIDAKPELEIYADDVKCAHGATVGQLDPEGLFYLRSRGIDEVSARTMLSFAFLASIVEQFPLEPLRDGVRAELERAFSRPAADAPAGVAS
jgi:Fe-S cluster assembly protein SufD